MQFITQKVKAGPDSRPRHAALRARLLNRLQPDHGLADGIEIFPKQDELRREEFGNAIRGPLGVHWGARESRGWRYWFYGADYKLEDQLAYPYKK